MDKIPKGYPSIRAIGEICLTEEIEQLQAENERLKAENDEILNHCYDGVYEENDRLEKENERLKAELEYEKRERAITLENLNIASRDNGFFDRENKNLSKQNEKLRSVIFDERAEMQALRKENARFRCSILHLFKIVLCCYENKFWFLSLAGNNRQKDCCYRRLSFIRSLIKRNDKSYRKAKKALMEGK